MVATWLAAVVSSFTADWSIGKIVVAAGCFTGGTMFGGLLF